MKPDEERLEVHRVDVDLLAKSEVGLELHGIGFRRDFAHDAEHGGAGVVVYQAMFRPRSAGGSSRTQLGRLRSQAGFQSCAVIDDGRPWQNLDPECLVGRVNAP